MFVEPGKRHEALAERALFFERRRQSEPLRDALLVEDVLALRGGDAAFKV